MTFVPEKVPQFLSLFEERKAEIAAFPGCGHLELWQENGAGNIFFTYSLWDTEDDLENYRNSALFKDTWKRTKSLFEADAEAWSLEECAAGT